MKHRFLSQRIFKENLFIAKDVVPIYQEKFDDNVYNNSPIEKFNEAMIEDKFENSEDPNEDDEESSKK